MNLVEIGYIRTSIKYAKYKESLLNKLKAAGIEVTLKSTKYGQRLLVDESQEIKAHKIVLIVPFY
jgi:hypothetical protein